MRDSSLAHAETGPNRVKPGRAYAGARGLEPALESGAIGSDRVSITGHRWVTRVPGAARQAPADSPPAMGDARPPADLPQGLSPDATAQLRRLLKLAPNADDDAVLRSVTVALRLTDAALEVGFTKAFNEAVAGGRVDVGDRDHWAECFYENPDTTREFLAQKWSITV